MFSFFKLSPTKMRAQQLHDNQVSLLQHKQAAAYHQAMSLYLQGEVGRLSADVEAEKVAASLPTVAPEWVKTEMRSKGRDQATSTLWAEPAVWRSNKAFGGIPAGEPFTHRTPGVKKDRRETNFTAGAGA